MARLARLNEQQKIEIKLFGDKMQENNPEITEVLDDLIDTLADEEQWFQKLTTEQVNLIKAVLI